MPKDNWHSFHNLKVSIENAISSCSDSAFGSDVRWEIQTILENTEKRIQRILDKNFAVKPKDFDKYEIETMSYTNGYEQHGCYRYLRDAKKDAMKLFNQGGYVVVHVLKDHGLVWEINILHEHGHNPNK